MGSTKKELKKKTEEDDLYRKWSDDRDKKLRSSKVWNQEKESF